MMEGGLKDVRLQPATEADLPMILRWRNHPRVRGVMFSNHVISPEEHQGWWLSVCEDPARQVMIFSVDEVPLGVVNYFDIDPQQRTCHWGFFLDSERNQNPGDRIAIWLALEQAAIDYAFNRIGATTLICETFESNIQVHQLHKKFGFEVVEQMVKERNGKDESVLVMALHKESGGCPPPETEPTAKGERVAFLGSANWDLVGCEFERTFREVTKREAAVFSVPFAQYRAQLWDAHSDLQAAELDYVILCERFEDFFDSAFSIFDGSQKSAFLERFDEYVDVIKTARQNLRGVLLVLDFVPVKPLPESLQASEVESVGAFVEAINLRLKHVCDDLADCYLVRLSTLVSHYGSRNADPQKFWHLARAPFSRDFASQLCRYLIKYLLALQGETVRVLVTDLDNTLWGGVVGDDGLENLKLGGDFPGSAFVEIQKTLKTLRNRGIALAVCSKNTERVAAEVFEKHPEMILKLDDFASVRINWRDKVQNLREIADEIGVGLSSLCFIDDSPYERAAVRQMLPEVIVPELPADATSWPVSILSHPYLASLSLTREDQIRAQQYESRARVKREAKKFSNKEDYWTSLKMKLFIHPLADWNKQRVLQLLSKTNQFNMTTRRYSEGDLDGLAQEGAMILAIGLADKFSQREIVGVLILKPGNEGTSVDIDSFLLSCRVLGRDVENGLLSWACRHYRELGFSQLTGRFIETPRNLPASRVYEDFGFKRVNAGYYRLDLKSNTWLRPDWFDVIEEID